MDRGKRVLVSVIISTYNSAKFIEGRLKNLVEQTIFEDIEIVIINSGSRQNEEEILQKYLKIHSNIKYIRTEDRETIYKAWNRGIKVAKGEFITNGNTDDRLRKDALEILSNYLQKYSNLALVYADQYIVKSAEDYEKNENLIGEYIRPDYSPLQLCYQYFAGSQSMWRSSLHYTEDIWFDDAFEVAGDYDFITKVALRHDIRHIKEKLGYYYMSPKQSNKEFQNINRTVRETIRIQESFTHQYINSLEFAERNKLLKRLNCFQALPSRGYSLIKKISDRFFKNWILPTRIYMTYLISVILESQREIDKALKICLKYEDNKYAYILHDQISRLKKGE